MNHTINATTLGKEIAVDVAGRAGAADRAGKLPADDAALLKSSGYTTLNVPQDWGGPGVSLQDCVAAQLELAKASTSTALVAGMNMQVLGHYFYYRHWREDVLRQVIAEGLENGLLINSVASEPKLGSPSRGGTYQTTARESDDGQEWVITGHKNWITGGKHLTHLFVKLSVGESDGTIMVPAGAPGVRWDETWGEALSLRASDSHDLYFENAVVPIGNRVDNPSLSAGPNVWFPLVMAATYLGGALGARDALIRYTLERVPTALGKPIATLPKIQRQIGEIDVELQAAVAFLLQTAALPTADQTAAQRKALMPTLAAAKTMATSAANRGTEKALTIAGGASISQNLPLERFFRDVRAGSMHPPSGDTAYEMIGRAAIESIGD